MIGDNFYVILYSEEDLAIFIPFNLIKKIDKSREDWKCYVINYDNSRVRGTWVQSYLTSNLKVSNTKFIRGELPGGYRTFFEGVFH